MAANVDILISAKDNASGPIAGISRSLGNLAKLTVGIGVAGAAAFVALGKQALDATAEWERMEMTMQSLVARELKASDATLTMADALGQATGRSEELLGWIEKLAIQSPFDIEGVAAAFRTALAYGFTSEKAQTLTQNMIDFAAATGQPVSVMNQMALALGQVQAKGKLAGQEILQLVNAGVPVNDILKGMGFTLDDVSKGLVSADEFLEAFSQTMESDFGGAAARQTDTWAGLLNSFDDIKKIGLRELFAGIFDQLQPLATAFSNWLQGDGLDKLREWGATLGSFAKNIIAGFQALKNVDLSSLADNLIYALSSAWVNVTARFDETMAGVDWQGLSQAIAAKIDSVDWGIVGDALTRGVGNILLGLWEFFSNVDWASLFDSVVQAVAEFIPGLFGTSFDEVRAQADVFWADLAAKGQAHGAAVAGVLSQIAAAWSTVWNTIKVIVAGAMTAVAGAVMQKVTIIRNAFAGIITAIKTVIEWVKKLIEAFADILLPPALTPGSPTPFEIGLLGINKALKKVGSTAPKIGILDGQSAGAPLSYASAPSFSGGGTVINLTYAPAVSLASERELMDHLLPVIQQGIRSSRRNA